MLMWVPYAFGFTLAFLRIRISSIRPVGPNLSRHWARVTDPKTVRVSLMIFF